MATRSRSAAGRGMWRESRRGALSVIPVPPGVVRGRVGVVEEGEEEQEED